VGGRAPLSGQNRFVNARRITIAVGLTMLVESTLYQAVVPLLPSYADRFDLSKTGAGVVLAAYPLPTPVIGLLAGLVTPRIGGRRMALGGSALLTFSTIAFALAPSAEVLVGARMLQGIAAGITWAASMAWLSANTPRDRLPREAGIVMGLFSTGAVIGPGVGSFAHATSPLLAFSCLAGAAALTIPLAWRAPVGVTIAPEPSYVRSLGSVLRNRLVVAAILLSVIDPVSLGAIDLLVPRHLHGHGVPTWHIGAALMTGAALGAGAGPLAGRLAERIGPLRVGIFAATALVALPTVLITELSDPAQLILLVAVAPAFTIMATAMYPLSTRGADARGVSHGVVNGVLSVTWATSFAIGSLATGVLADRHGDTSTYAAVAIVCAVLLATLAVISRGTARPAPAV
jgi:MFS transporter, DHA1 family, solute carrier family 18 (vesicular amine transporter), member 1/2